MPIVTSDLEYRLLNPAASAGNQLDQLVPAASLGGYMSKTVWDGLTIHDLFAAVTGDENADLVSEYRCLYLINKHASLSFTSPVLWFVTLAARVNMAIGVDPTPARGVATNQLQAIITPDKNTTPSGVVFSAPTSKITGISLGNIPAGHGKAVWIRRVTTNSTSQSADTCSLRVEGDTL